MKTLVTVVQRTTATTTRLRNKLQIWQVQLRSAVSNLAFAERAQWLYCTKTHLGFCTQSPRPAYELPPSFLGPSVPLPTIQRECMGGHRIHPTTSIHPSIRNSSQHCTRPAGGVNLQSRQACCAERQHKENCKSYPSAQPTRTAFF